jgi:hypothetical protein
VPLSAALSPDSLLPAATTTARLTTALLAASDAAARALPDGLHHACALDLLLRLFLADEAARLTRLDELPSGSCSPEAVRRWIAALVSVGYVERRGAYVALSAIGHRGVTAITEAAARALIAAVDADPAAEAGAGLT